MKAQPAGRPQPAQHHKASYTIAVEPVAASPWVDTGIDVEAGELLTTTASGTLTLSDGRSTGPAGLARGWRDLLRQFPLNSAQNSVLLGRIGGSEAATPFVLGTETTISMPSRGRLFLGVNLSPELAGSGAYRVILRFKPASSATLTALSSQTQPAAAETGSVRSQAPVPIDRSLSPSLFTGLPRRVADVDGHPGDMVNFALLGNETQVKAAFDAAGWNPVDANVADAVLHGVLATLGREAYTAVPMSTLYLFGRPQDLSYARADPIRVAADRHHLRVWKTSLNVNGMPLWIGSATHDIGFEHDERNGKMTHRIDPAIDLERDFLLQSFDTAGRCTSAAYVTPPDPFTDGQTATGGDFHSDGRIVVMALP